MGFVKRERLLYPDFREGCESGLIGTPGKRMCRKAPWVRIPPLPLFVAIAPQSLRPAIYNSDEDTELNRAKCYFIG